MMVGRNLAVLYHGLALPGVLLSHRCPCSQAIPYLADSYDGDALIARYPEATKAQVVEVLASQLGIPNIPPARLCKVEEPCVLQHLCKSQAGSHQQHVDTDKLQISLTLLKLGTLIKVCAFCGTYHRRFEHQPQGEQVVKAPQSMARCVGRTI